MKRFVQYFSVLTLMCCLLTAGPLFAQGKVDINNADVKGLMSLKGIGEVKAKAIVKYRQMNGPFSSAEDLKNVPGVGDKIVKDNKSQIAVGKGMGKKSGASKAKKEMKGAKDKSKKAMKSTTDKSKKSMKDTTSKSKKAMKSTTDKAKKGGSKTK